MGSLPKYITTYNKYHNTYRDLFPQGQYQWQFTPIIYIHIFQPSIHLSPKRTQEDTKPNFQYSLIVQNVPIWTRIFPSKAEDAISCYIYLHSPVNHYLVGLLYSNLLANVFHQDLQYHFSLSCSVLQITLYVQRKYCTALKFSCYCFQLDII